MSDVTPTAAHLDTAHHWLGCTPNKRDEDGWPHEDARCLDGHGWGDDGWPCPVAVDLAAKIAARDAQTRADECDQIAATPYIPGWLAVGLQGRAATHRAGTTSE